MKKLISILLLISLLANTAFASCDWKTGITPGPNNTFVYTEACHLEVGQLVQTNKTQAAQIQDLTKAISLKDLALTNSDARAALWESSANTQLDRLNKIESSQKTNDFLYFGLGIIATIGTGLAVARLAGK